MSYRVSLGLCLALLVVWSLPGTIALRGVLLVAAAVSLLLAMERSEWRSLLQSQRVPLWLIFAISLCFLVQAALLSHESAWALGELRGQWIPALVALVLGMLLAIRVRREGDAAPTRLVLLITLALGIEAAAVATFWPWLRQYHPLPDFPLTGVKIEFTFVLNIVFVFVATDMFQRATGRKPMFGRYPVVSLAMLAVIGIGTYLVQGRNGMAGLAFLVSLFLALYLFDRRHRFGAQRILVGVAVALVVMAGLAVDRYRSNPYWKELQEAAAIGWALELGRFPQLHTSEWPTRADGRPVEHSALARTAAFHQGLMLIAAHPLGYGYGRNAYGHALQAHRADARGHAHSGWIDLGVGGGIPGLLLWAAFLGALVRQGWRAFRRDDNPYGLLLLLLSAGHGFRMIFDSVNRDHMLQMFMFLAGLLLVLANWPRAEERP